MAQRLLFVAAGPKSGDNFCFKNGQFVQLGDLTMKSWHCGCQVARFFTPMAVEEANGSLGVSEVDYNQGEVLATGGFKVGKK